jgi:hypothetical protein
MTRSDRTMEKHPNRQTVSAVHDSKEEPAKWSLDALAGEIATYRAQVQDMAKAHEGEFALIKGTEIVGFFPDDASALREGHRRFGKVPFLVKQIIANERAVYIPNVVL